MPSGSLLIVGAGASGLACAVACGRAGIDTTVLERTSSCGRKLAIAGGHKCNLCHAASPREMAGRFDAEAGLLSPLFRRFSWHRVTGFFESIGVGCRTDDEGRIWPVGTDAAGVRDALLRAAVAAGVRVRTTARATAVLQTRHGWQVEAAGSEFTGSFLCLATGGASHPGTGSSGDGLGLCRRLGLSCIDWFPALASLQTRDDIARLAGITQPDVGLRLFIDETRTRVLRGPLLFAHRYLSGTAVLNLSGHASRALADGGRARLEIDWLPGRNIEETRGSLESARQQHPRRLAANLFAGPLSRRLAAFLVERAGMPADRTAADISRAEARALVAQLKSCSFDIVGTEPIERATVTGGGVALDEIDLRTSESRRLPGLYVVGELLDAWAQTGGYNLHFAWATALAAAESIAGRKLE